MKQSVFAFLRRGVIKSEQLLQTELLQDKTNQVFMKPSPKSRNHSLELNKYWISMKQSVFAFLKHGVIIIKSEQLLQTELHQDKRN